MSSVKDRMKAEKKHLVTLISTGFAQRGGIPSQDATEISSASMAASRRSADAAASVPGLWSYDG